MKLIVIIILILITFHLGSVLMTGPKLGEYLAKTNLSLVEMQLAPFPLGYIFCPQNHNVFASGIQYHRYQIINGSLILVCSPCINEAGSRDSLRLPDF